MKMKYWEDMTKEEKLDVCRDCPYFYGEVDADLCDEAERSPYDADEKACHWLKKRN